jgi:hypothetical protein
VLGVSVLLSFLNLISVNAVKLLVDFFFQFNLVRDMERDLDVFVFT